MSKDKKISLLCIAGILLMPFSYYSSIIMMDGCVVDMVKSKPVCNPTIKGVFVMGVLHMTFTVIFSWCGGFYWRNDAYKSSRKESSSA